MRVIPWVVVAGMVATVGRAGAADQPLLGSRVLLQRDGATEKLVFTARDPALLFPAIGSADDPGTGTPGGAIVEVFSAGEGMTVLTAPPGVGRPGWSAKAGMHPRHEFVNGDAPAPPSPLRLLVIKQGKALKIRAYSTGLPLVSPQGSIGIRVTTGTIRNCAFFGPESIVHDEPGRFVARTAPAPADCSDATLGAPPPCETAMPMCNGTCPTGEQCFATMSGNQCVCLPTGSTPCGTPGAPTCGGECPNAGGCEPAFLPLAQGGSLTCGCNVPDCGNGFAYGVDDFGQPGCFIILCGGTYPTCGGGCGDGGECVALHVTPPVVPSSLEYCVCAVPGPCCGGGYDCASGGVCTSDGNCTCSPP